MPPVGTRELLALWDTATNLDRIGRALVLARPNDDERPRAIGHDLARLLELRSSLFGDSIAATAGCPRCAAQAELPLKAGELLALGAKIVDEPLPLSLDGWSVSWRPLTLLDLQAAARCGDPTLAELELLRRCILDAIDASGSHLPGDRLPRGMRSAVANALEAADPLSEVLLGVTCPDCRTEFEVELDLASFIWAEIDVLARSVLLDVDALARAYGWSEEEVLSLTVARRATYLRIVRDGTP